MSIAALLQAAEYLERRERGEFGRVVVVILESQSTSTWLPCQLLAWKSADFDALLIFLLQRPNMDTHQHCLCQMISEVWKDQRQKNLREAGWYLYFVYLCSLLFCAALHNASRKLVCFIHVFFYIFRTTHNELEKNRWVEMNNPYAWC